MTTNPFYNAFLATAYIVIVVSTIFNLSRILEGREETILLPMAGLGLFVLSVAVMAFLFFYRPVLMLLDGEREKAVKFFLQTVGIFALSTGIIFLISLIVTG